MANQLSHLSLYEKVHLKNSTQRALDVTILLLLLCLLFYRLLSLNHYGLTWFLAFLCESWFTFNWLLLTTTRWTPILFKPFPERLHQCVPETELPPVDMFVTTADPVLEPPILTVNTVLSLLAVNYPANRLACYVSDDGCSPLVFYSLVEASKFAELWVPFCKKYNVQVRAPFRYFLDDSALSVSNSLEFRREWSKIKEGYEQLRRNIEDAARKPGSFDLTGDFAVFSNTEIRNHPTIIKVIWENKEGLSDGVPHIIYIAREKRPKDAHHYKAGAMNVLTRVSGVMTNAPFMLNVDCDMYVNNPEIFRQALCLLLGSKKERDCGFVQCPQRFYDRPEQYLVFNEYVGKGIAGIQGSLYYGSGCFHRRKVIYGLWPDDLEDEGKFNKKLDDNELQKEFGDAKEFIKSVTQALKGETYFPSNLSKSLKAAHQVAACTYACGSSWGKKLGWRYGSLAEDMLTGLAIHSGGWRSGYLSPDPPAFLGCAPPGGPSSTVQHKRWATGILEILFSKSNPISATLTAKLQFRQCLAYLSLLFWGLRPIPELCYAVLPAYCIIVNSNFLPKAPEIHLFLAPFVLFNICNLSEFIRTGFPVRVWWISQCMTRISTLSGWLFGAINIVPKLLGLKETTFEVTRKGQSASAEDGEEKFIFDESPFFVPITTVVLIHLMALATNCLGLQPRDGQGPGQGEFFCSVYVLLSFMPFVQGLFRKGKCGIPSSTIFKSAALALCFVHFCKRSSVTLG